MYNQSRVQTTTEIDSKTQREKVQKKDECMARLLQSKSTYSDGRKKKQRKICTKVYMEKK